VGILSTLAALKFSDIEDAIRAHRRLALATHLDALTKIATAKFLSLEQSKMVQGQIENVLQELEKCR
jgi:hypothetical protein